MPSLQASPTGTKRLTLHWLTFHSRDKKTCRRSERVTDITFLTHEATIASLVPSDQRGAQAVCEDPKGFARIMWETWSPQGWFDDIIFDRVAISFDNPDWVDVTLHSYRSR
jgi:hypothetical protein